MLAELLKNHPWDSDWPVEVTSTFGPTSLVLPPVLASANISVEIGSEVNLVNQFIAALQGSGSCPLNDLKAQLQALVAWTNQARHFTYPPSHHGWELEYQDLCRAVDGGATVARPLLLFITACYPAACQLVLSQMPDSAVHRLLSIVSASSKVDRAFPLAPASSPSSSISSSGPSSAQVVQEVSPSIQSANFKPPVLLPKLAKITSLLITGDWDAPTKKEWFDNKLKWLRKQHQETTPDGWFTNQLFPALALLPEENLVAVRQFWPNAALSLMDSEFLGSNKFWGILKRAPARTYLLTTLLPHIISLANPSVVGMYGLGKTMVERTVNNPGEFSKRLRLWLALGGDLDMPLPPRSANLSAKKATPSAPQDSLFSTGPAQPYTFRSWLTSRHLSEWDNVLAKLTESTAVPETAPAPVPAKTKANKFSP